MKPKPYGRGVGKLGTKGFDENTRERYGLMNYPKCKEEYHSFGCCICSPNCPEGMTDIGIACTRQSYNRGNGTYPSVVIKNK